jgi:hypothetical protein
MGAIFEYTLTTVQKHFVLNVSANVITTFDHCGSIEDQIVISPMECMLLHIILTTQEAPQGPGYCPYASIEATGCSLSQARHILSGLNVKLIPLWLQVSALYETGFLVMEKKGA